MTFDAINLAIATGSFFLVLGGAAIIVALIRGQMKRHAHD